MLGIPSGRLRYEDNWGTAGSANLGTSITTGASSSTKGSFTQLIASTAFDAYWVEVYASAYGSAGVASDCCLDIAIGAATEEIIIPDLLAGYCGNIATTGKGPRSWAFPLSIPAGTRLSARAAGIRTSTALRVGVKLIGGDDSPPFTPGRKVTTYGIGTVPNGTALVSGMGASGATGSWTQITASTSEDHFAVLPGMQLTNDNTNQLRSYWAEIGIGAATEEKIAGPYIFSSDTDEMWDGPFPNYPSFHPIPAGSRLTMRVSAGQALETAYDGVLHCVS